MFLRTKNPSVLHKPGSALASASCVGANHAGRLLAMALMALLLLLASLASAWAQDGAAATTPPPQSGSGIKTICPTVHDCFKTKEAKDAWAAKNNCQFLEDVCEKTPPSKDNQGASDADASVWENFFTTVKNALVYGYEFTKGLMSGLKEQVTDLISLVTNIGDVIDGLIKLGKAFYDDPKGTMAALAEMLGQDVIDTITKATQCGAYDLGKVIGQNINPAVMVKLAAKLAKFSGKVGDAVKAVKKEIDCASFTAGTWIHTRNGLLAIQTLRRNDWVHARDETHWLDAPQRITNTFGRVAPSYYELQTEYETFHLTAEHPLWVQGKGWIAVKDVEEGDVLAAFNGDALVLSNTLQDRSVPVYNFSVANTPNYFVGESGLWAHNASKLCKMPYDRNQYGTKLPTDSRSLESGAKNGQWGAERGNSFYQPNTGTKQYAATGGKPVEYKNGYPVFEPFAVVNPKTGKPIIVDNVPGMDGSDTDFTKADKAYRAAIGDPTWTRDKNNYVWHHHENCKKMVLVPKGINNEFPHTGGASKIKNKTC